MRPWALTKRGHAGRRVADAVETGDVPSLAAWLRAEDAGLAA